MKLPKSESVVFVVVLLCLFFVVGVTKVSAATVPGLAFSERISGLSGLTDIANTGISGDDRLFVTEQSTGRIRIYDIGDDVMVGTFLNIGSGGLDLIASGGEKGLLGLAFHPNYQSNGYFFVAYTDQNSPFNVVVDRFTATGDPNTSIVANTASRKFIISVPKPFDNHNGGDLAFGPDGYLYISIGDGGSSNDPGNNAQRIDTLLGKIMRFDVNTSNPYAFPPSNPFMNKPGRDPIWAYGLRNPWRIAFDELTGDFWISDVGQGSREEVNFQPRNKPGAVNYGWRCREGNIANPAFGSCTQNGPAIGPIGWYDHNFPSGGQGGCSVTGGYVYRGSDYPAMYGKYFFMDFCSGVVHTLEPARNNSGGWEQTYQGEFITSTNVTTFGESVDNELYVGTSDGQIYQVTAGSPAALPGAIRDSGNAAVDTSWRTIPFATSFTQKPVVQASIISENGSEKVYLDIRNVSTTGFEARILENSRAGLNPGHTTEEISWYANQRSYEDSGNEEYVGAAAVDSNWRTIAFPVVFSTTPKVLVTKQSSFGAVYAYPDVRNVTTSSFQVRMEEPPGFDDIHSDEIIGWSAFETHPFETSGTASIDSDWQTIPFGTTLTGVPILVANTMTNGDSQASTLDIRNVTTTGFDARIQEESTLDGIHGSETIAWLVDETSAVDTQNGFLSVDSNWKQVYYPKPFNNNSMVWTQINTNNGSDTANTDVRNVTKYGFQIRIEEDPKQWNGIHTFETVAWIAQDAETASENIQDEVIGTNWTTFSYDNGAFGGVPFLMGQIQTDNGTDTVALDFRNVTASGFDVRLEEDMGAGWDGAHTNETVAFYAFTTAPMGASGTLALTDDWQTQVISQPSTPKLFATIYSENGAGTVQLDQRNVDNNRFDYRLEEERNYDNIHVNESGGYWVFP